MASQSRSNLLLGLNLGLAGVDLAQTIHAKNHGYTELNPLYSGSTTSVVILKAATTTAILVTIYKLTKPNSKNRYLALITYGAIQGFVVIHNWRVSNGR